MTQTTAATEPSLVPHTPGWRERFAKRLPLVTSVGVSFGIVGLNLVQGILLARLLGAEGRGEYATAILFTQVLLYIGLFGGIEVIARYAANANVAVGPLRQAAVRLSLLTATLTAGLVIVANLISLPTDRQYLLPLGIACSLSVFGQQLSLIVSAVDRGRGDFTAFNLNRLYAAAIFPALLIGAWAFNGISVNVACALYTLSATLSCIPLLWKSFTAPAVSANQEHAAAVTEEPVPDTWTLFREGRPYALSMLATDLLERFDLLLFMWFTSLVVQGHYSAMLPVAFPLTVIPNTLGIFLFNAGALAGGQLTRPQVLRVFGATCLVQAAMTCGFWLVVGPVVRFVYGEEFEPAIQFAMWLAPIAAIKGIVQGLESYLKGRGQPMITVHLRMLAAVVMGLTIAGLYPWTGYLAIIQGSLMGQVACVLSLVLVIYQQAVAAQPPAESR